MSTSSARPDALVAYPTHAGPHNDTARHHVHGIDEVIETLRTTSHDYLPLPSLYRLESELMATLARAREIDERVGDIGRAFLEADGTDGGITTMPDRQLARQSDGIPMWLRDFVVADLFNVWDGRSGGTPYGKLGAGGLQIWGARKWLAEAADARRAKELAEGPGRWAIHAHGDFPTSNNGFTARTVTRAPHLRGAATWLSQPGTTALFRKAGVAGGAWSTVSDAKNLLDQGNMADAYEREGAGYVADLARTGFSASSTAFLFAPTPAAAGAMLVTGVVWAGAEVWDHWGDDISAFVDEKWDAGWEHASDAAGAVGDAVSNAWSGATDRVSNAWDGVTDVVSDLGKGADLAADAVGNVASAVTDRLPSFSW